MPKYQRILLKLSGEVMAGAATFGIDADRVRELANEAADVAKAEVQLGIVVGGGNIFRGVAAAASNVDRVTADHMGMLATVINSLALQDSLEQMGVPTRVMSAIQMNQVAEPYIRRRAIRHLEKGRIVIFAGGTSIRISPPIQRPRCVLSKSRRRSSPKRPGSMACTIRTR